MSEVSFGIVFSYESEEYRPFLMRLLKIGTEQCWPLIVVFNDPRSETLKWVMESLEGEKYSEECGEGFSKIPKLILHTSSKSIGEARNLLVQNCKTDFLYMTDPDVEHRGISLSHWVDESIKLMKSSGLVAAVGGNNLYVSSNSTFSTLQRYFNLAKDKFLLHGGSLQYKQYNQPCEIDHAPTCHVLYRTAALKKIGGFKSEYSFVGEDLELSQRLVVNSYKIYVLPGCEAEQIFAGGITSWLKKMFIYGQAQAFVAKEHSSFQKTAKFKMLMLAKLLAIAWLALLAFFPEIAIAAVALYVVFLTIYLRDLSVAFLALAVHVCYFCGEVRGLLKIAKIV